MNPWLGLDEWMDEVREWVAAAPHAQNPAGIDASRAITERHLTSLGFSVERVEASGHPAVVLARRPPQGTTRWVGLYGHYDVEPAGVGWTTEPTTLTGRNGRVYGVGVGDNLGPLALRLLAMREATSCPGLVWIIEGEEETGSALAQRSFSAGAFPDVELWIDETGYFYRDGDQRVLALDLDAEHRRALEPVAALAKESGRSVRYEARRLHRVAGTGPEMVDAGRAYLAIGPNDDFSGVHGPNESLSLELVSLAACQFRTLLEALAD